VAAVYGSQLYTSTDGAAWTIHEDARDWRSVASSADGAKLLAAVSNGQLYTSTDGGLNWTARESARNWTSVPSSADGATLVAVVYGGHIFTGAYHVKIAGQQDSAIELVHVGSGQWMIVNKQGLVTTSP
jgi:hypothetical protein